MSPSVLSPAAAPVGRRAFSLVEVVIAVGIFAVAVITIVGLLVPNTKQVAAQVEAQVAQRLADNIRLELERYGYHNVTSGLNAAADRLFLVATQDGTRVLITGEDPYAAWNDTYGNYDPDSAANYPAVASPLAAEKKLETDGSPDNPPGIAFRDRFFLIEVAWPSYPQFNNNNRGAVPLNIRVLWPYRLPNGPASPTSSSAYNDKDNLPWRVVAPADHSTMLFNVVLTP
jgi:type II secretory pathway pseudopilin PulG